MTFVPRFRLLFVAASFVGLVLSGSAFAATDGFGNDNFKGSYFNNQAPAALADDNDTTLNGITPAAGDATQTKTDAAKTGEAVVPQSSENGNPPASATQENEQPVTDTNLPSGASGHSP